ncbi:MAG: hypothetical protein AB8B77_08575, partial [Alphaproteobacteria bacterium]
MMIKRTLLLSGIITLFLVVQPNHALSGMLVQDNAALAKWSEQIKAMKEELKVVQEQLDVATEQLSVINEVSEEAKKTVNAIGEMTRIDLPFLNLAKLTDQIVSDAFCLLPDLENMLPDIRFNDLDWNNVCEASNAYKETLFYKKVKKAATDKIADELGFDQAQQVIDSKMRGTIRFQRQVIEQDGAVKAMAQSDTSRKAAEDLAASADELFASAQAAESLNQRMAIQNQASITMLKGVAQTNMLLSQLLKIQTNFAIRTMPPDFAEQIEG